MEITSDMLKELRAATLHNTLAWLGANKMSLISKIETRRFFKITSRFPTEKAKVCSWAGRLKY